MHCYIEQYLFIPGGCHPSHGTHLGVTHFADSKGGQDLGQRRQSTRYPDLLTGGAHAHTAFPVQPVRTGIDAIAMPATFFIKHLDQFQ